LDGCVGAQLADAAARRAGGGGEEERAAENTARRAGKIVRDAQPPLAVDVGARFPVEGGQRAFRLVNPDKRRRPHGNGRRRVTIKGGAASIRARGAVIRLAAAMAAGQSHRGAIRPAQRKIQAADDRVDDVQRYPHLLKRRGNAAHPEGFVDIANVGDGARRVVVESRGRAHRSAGQRERHRQYAVGGGGHLQFQIYRGAADKAGLRGDLEERVIRARLVGGNARIGRVRLHHGHAVGERPQGGAYPAHRGGVAIGDRQVQ